MIAMTFTSPLYAAGYEKAKAGAEKIVKSPVQIYDNIKGEYDSAGLNPFGLFGGLMKGLFFTGRDVVSGLVDILTFPVDL